MPTQSRFNLLDLYNTEPKPYNSYGNTDLNFGMNAPGSMEPITKDTLMGSNPNSPGYLNYPAVNNPMADLSFGGAGNVPGNTPNTPSFMQGMVGSKEFGPGWGGIALNAAQGLGSFYLGSKQYGLAKDQLNTNRQQFSDQFNLQRQLINQDIMDKSQKAYERNPDRNPNPNEYYEANRIR